jgi:uncharacterized protein (DUF488 family)
MLTDVVADDVARLPLITVGHGTRSGPELTQALVAAGVDELVDVRRFPGSRRDPTLSSDALTASLGEAGLRYGWEQDLGGRRHLMTGQVSPDSWWTVAAFRAYAAHTRTEEFAAALERVLKSAASGRVAVMCSESVWWRCHRRLIADVVVLAYGLPVKHLMPDGRLTAHRVAEGARRSQGKKLVWDEPTVRAGERS